MRGTDKRAELLQSEYRRKARGVDQVVLGVNTQERGPVERRLDEFGSLLGLCFGAWGEGSEGVHHLIQTLAESRLKFQGLQRGRPGSDAELDKLVGQVKRRIYLPAVECLLVKHDCIFIKITNNDRKKIHF